MSGLTRDDWIATFAAELGVDPPDADTIETLLELAGTAAHASERTAAPIACYLVGLARVRPVDARATAAAVSPPG